MKFIRRLFGRPRGRTPFDNLVRSLEEKGILTHREVKQVIYEE